jgi:hypothetical protein
MQKHSSWRAIEAMAHRTASENPNQFVRVWLENHENEFTSEVTIESSSRGFLTDKSVAALRAAKEIVDGSEDFDGARVYTIEVLEVGPKERRVSVARPGRMS